MEKRKNIKPDYGKLLSAFGEASSLSIIFVFFPVIFLVLGVFLDKKFGTMPLFIILGVGFGIAAFAYQVKKVLSNLRPKDDQL
ncbi:hypothetical protein A3A76_04000 [Candidatus Woesebacteria bacterium RIFCSPLOWO2_01_FULL_39_23]|uniref:F0F1 ATP synthase subunit n=1 Tax=Candidatus Woesebacteria bacterium RIFCSPHIGHO2_01_FULL_40_22 TaxID=1802499 RepID=A0A1F7YJV1_9BACT|nr:MAG: hypothetical protein A2141_00005 [Candidatus Woesebacteria bacterium RBG_16_40_11]OGM27616.1 MAG: hypothetical protein A2628_02400 [Candidatus Woesebacteria bacterium RIFCSPHIGHO2_01_FULL_40_22]OGM36769.1 MAG: hypothetical protein A3E41_03250 [Candidatus Woesebacteria bacterium RIFCSPHIGHO2_12_FULL_38_9]OGM62790.1 MAG: hypothetical protein A3A76_04000 [Candidatus Woesebacteria bacterium RIFCSPLOWO2_01_FULL_39_23]